MAVGREFFADKCLLHASALAFTTILSFIPFLAVMFALMKGFGAATDLEILILNHLALGSEEVVDAVFTYINNTSMAKLGTFGVIFLLLTVLTLLNSIENSFNHIWRVKETRSLARLFSDYLSITIFGPILDSGGDFDDHDAGKSGPGQVSHRHGGHRHHHPDPL